MKLSDIQSTHTREAYVPAAAATTSDTAIAFVAPFDLTITGVSFTATAAATGNTTNTRTFTLVNAGTDGSGTDIAATLALITGVDLVANVPKDFTNGTEALRQVDAGETVIVNSVYANSGLAHSDGIVTVEFEGR